MEDKWFWYMEGDTLYIHRSWTGFCIYIVEFDFGTGRHKVTANTAPRQCRMAVTEIERKKICILLDWCIILRYTCEQYY